MAFFRETWIVTLGWTPDADITLLKVDDEVASQLLVCDSGPVRVIAVGKKLATARGEIGARQRLILLSQKSV